MGINADNGAVIKGDLVPNYQFETEKKNHEALIVYHWGPRCHERCRTCACCHMWLLFDSYWELMQEIVDENQGV